jgi:hypothetical protein
MITPWDATIFLPVNRLVAEMGNCYGQVPNFGLSTSKEQEG